MQPGAVTLVIVRCALGIAHIGIGRVLLVFLELGNAILELDNFNDTAKACSSSVSLELGQQVVIGGVLAAQPDVAQGFLFWCEQSVGILRTE